MLRTEKVCVFSEAGAASGVIRPSTTNSQFARLSWAAGSEKSRRFIVSGIRFTFCATVPKPVLLAVIVRVDGPFGESTEAIGEYMK